VKCGTNLQMFLENELPPSLASLTSTFIPEHTASHTTIKYCSCLSALGGGDSLALRPPALLSRKEPRYQF
jgi:hypothetical protein